MATCASIPPPHIPSAKRPTACGISGGYAGTREARGAAGAGAGGRSGATGGLPFEGFSMSEEKDNDVDDAPSELLAPLLEEWHEVLVTHVLSRLDPTASCDLDRTLGVQIHFDTRS